MSNGAGSEALLKRKKRKGWTRDDAELGLLGLPAVLWYFVFSFLPMFGLLGIDYGWGFDPILDSNGNKRTDTGMGKGQFHFTIGGMLGEL